MDRSGNPTLEGSGAEPLDTATISDGVSQKTGATFRGNRDHRMVGSLLGPLVLGSPPMFEAFEGAGSWEVRSFWRPRLTCTAATWIYWCLEGQ